jgi:7-keto-8-aminopelargonate synthetase-like enzyme
VLHRGRRLSYFGGCDYFRLASHPAVLQAAREGLAEYGLNVAASRLTTGNHRLYELLESRLADFFAVESAVLLSSGYVTNLVVAQALAGRFSHVLIDELSHSSLFDAAPVFDCPVMSFKHRDAAHVVRTLQRCGKSARPILLTEGMFSRDGEVAPLHAYLQVLPAEARLLVDDAHGAGTLGHTGRGTVEYLGVSTKRIIQTITLSKAFGIYGGVVLGPRALQGKISMRSPLFVGSTPLPLALASAALKAVALLKNDAALRQRLVRNTQLVKTALGQAGFAVVNTPSPIISLVPSHSREVPALQRRLLEAGIFPSFIRYPGGPHGGYFRFAISSEHSLAQLKRLVKVFVAYARWKDL